ncbi:MAG: DUF5667 domain-containing protein [Patescibacteria group bacterium]
MPAIVIALLIAAVLGGGTAVAAQNSLPGDTLWGFKTAVNENVQGALAINDEAKAGWAILLAVARLDEAQKLAAQGKLDDKAQAALQANFDAHAEDVAALVAKLQSKGNTAAAAAVATRWQAELAKHAEGITQASASFIADVRGTLDAAANLSASLDL